MLFVIKTQGCGKGHGAVLSVADSQAVFNPPPRIQGFSPLARHPQSCSPFSIYLLHQQNINK